MSCQGAPPTPSAARAQAQVQGAYYPTTIGWLVAVWGHRPFESAFARGHRSGSHRPGFLATLPFKRQPRQSSHKVAGSQMGRVDGPQAQGEGLLCRDEEEDRQTARPPRGPSWIFGDGGGGKRKQASPPQTKRRRERPAYFGHLLSNSDFSKREMCGLSKLNLHAPASEPDCTTRSEAYARPATFDFCPPYSRVCPTYHFASAAFCCAAYLAPPPAFAGRVHGCCASAALANNIHKAVDTFESDGPCRHSQPILVCLRDELAKEPVLLAPNPCESNECNSSRRAALSTLPTFSTLSETETLPSAVPQTARLF